MLLDTLKKIKRKIFNKQKERLRKNIIVEQEDYYLTISGSLSDDRYEVERLLFINREDEDNQIKVENEKQQNDFLFSFNYNDISNEVVRESIYDLYLYVKVHESVFEHKNIEKLKSKSKIYIDNNNDKFYSYPIRLGRFEETNTDGVCKIVTNEIAYTLYQTTKGNMSLAINKEIKQEILTQIDHLNKVGHKLKLDGKLFTRSHDIEEIHMSVIGRDTNEAYQFPTTVHYLAEDTKKRFGLNRYRFYTSVQMNEMIHQKPMAEDIYDLFFEIKFKNEDELRRIRIGKPRFMARRKIRHHGITHDNTAYLFNPYYTFRLRNLSIQINCFNRDTYKYLKRLMKWSWFVNKVNKKNDIWIIGERIHKAQDTGYHLFKYIRENYPEKEVYYVIDKDSEELDNVKELGNILYYKSKEHIKATIAATRIIGSHHPDYLYPLRTDEFKNKVYGKKVFLQHGVMGTKNMVANYGKDAPGFYTDMFMVSSDLEKEMIIDDFGYDRDQVKVTGLSRFDKLLREDVDVKRQLLIIPTWREWLTREELFLESEYLERYSNLIQSRELKILSEKYNFEIVLYLHVNMQKYIHYFNSEHVKIINPEEVDVQHLLKESAMMITDYSSVAFDFSFLHKPIIYYQFDVDRFIGRKGSHLDLENDLPGDIVYEEVDIMKMIEKYAIKDFQMSRENRQKANHFNKFRDVHSSERIFEAISKGIPRKSVINRAMNTELYRTLFNRFRNSKRYFPTMKKLYKIMKTILPVDEKLILFESGVGKQYADSPKVIYEEIIKKNLDYKFVWVCNKNIRLNDPNTVRIKRLSPSYYYYLAKAKYWINNQNFPTYIEKRPETTYIQTWHGTPLKKMLHDIENVMGRTDDYIERISKAIGYWDYLISPSAYATEAFKSAFQYEGDILEVGYPRNDIFYNSEKKELSNKVRKRLRLTGNKKIILYAPTFRDNQAIKNNRFRFDLEMDLHKMKEELGDDYIVLLRMHVAVTKKLKLEEELKDFVIDVSTYSDMQELLLITDILITDYSSVMFDFANTNKPMLFFTYDLEMYRDDVRGFYMDFEREAPGPLLRNTEEIINSIKNITNVTERFTEKYNTFYNNYCSKEDGTSSSKVVEKFFIK